MAEDCVRHARTFFDRPDLNLASAAPDSFSLTSDNGVLGELRLDYEKMSGMKFSKIPIVDEVVVVIALLEQSLNEKSKSGDL